jgi:Caspase domain
MGKYAVSVGVNYTDNPEAALKGCVNDSYIIRSILLAKDFKDEDIRMLNDVDNGAEQPTGPNVRKALEWLCTDRTADDCESLQLFHTLREEVSISAWN